MMWCPTPDCFLVFIKVNGQIDFECPICKKDYCMECRTSKHVGKPCKKFDERIERDAEYEEVINLLKELGGKQCP